MANNNNASTQLVIPSVIRKQSVISTATNATDNDIWKKNSRKYCSSRASIFSGSSLQMLPNRRPVVHYENTYRIDIDKNSDAFFKSRKAENILKEILLSNLERYQYDAQSVAVLTQNITNIIKNRLKELESVRYKYICQVFLGQKRCGNGNHNNSIIIASQMLSQPNSGDSFAEFKYENSTLIAIGIIHGIYYE